MLSREEFTELARSRARNQIPIQQDKPETFVIRQNIARYRGLLAAGRLDENQRRTIGQMFGGRSSNLSGNLG